MAEIDLPFVEARTSPDGVLKTLTEHRRAAAVTRVGGELRLVTIAEVRKAQAAETPTVGDVARTVLEPGVVSIDSRDEPDDEDGQEDFSDALAFSVFPLRRGGGANRARRGGDAIARVNGPEFGDFGASFVCNGRAPENGADAPHMFPSPTVVLNDQCPNCVTPSGGSPPTIRALF